MDKPLAGALAFTAVQKEVRDEIRNKYDGEPGDWLEAQGIDYDQLIGWCRRDVDRAMRKGLPLNNRGAMVIGMQLGLRLGQILGPPTDK